MIVGNTTVLRPPACGMPGPPRNPAGLSGRPLFGALDPMLGGDLCARRGRLPLIGTGRHRLRPRRARQDQGRASLVQLYSSWCSAGSALSARSRAELVQALARGAGIPDLVGVMPAAVTAAEVAR